MNETGGTQHLEATNDTANVANVDDVAVQKVPEQVAAAKTECKMAVVHHIEKKATEEAEAAKTNRQGATDDKMIYRGQAAESASRAEETAQGDQGEETGTAGVTPASVVQQPEMFEEKAAKQTDAAETNCQEVAKKKQISATATDCQGSAKNQMIYRGLVTK